jgi:hypothetical protein
MVLRANFTGVFDSFLFNPTPPHICSGPSGHRYVVEFYVNILLFVFVCKIMLESVGLSVNSKTSPRIRNNRD